MLQTIYGLAVNPDFAQPAKDQIETVG